MSKLADEPALLASGQRNECARWPVSRVASRWRRQRVKDERCAEPAGDAAVQVGVWEDEREVAVLEEGEGGSGRSWKRQSAKPDRCVRVCEAGATCEEGATTEGRRGTEACGSARDSMGAR